MISVRADGGGWLAEWVGPKGPTQAWSGCPWDAALRCVRFMVYRFETGWEPAGTAGRPAKRRTK